LEEGYGESRVMILARKRGVEMSLFKRKSKDEKQASGSKCQFYIGGNCSGGEYTAPCSWNPDSFHDCAVYKLTVTGDISHLYPPGTRITKT